MLPLGIALAGICSLQAQVGETINPEGSSTANPTGMQIGVESSGASLPPETLVLAREGAIASADRDWDKAREIYEEILEMAPENALAYSNLAAVEFRLGNLLEAANLLDKAVALSPEVAQNWLTLGLIYYRLGRPYYYQSISALSRSIVEDSENPRAHNYLGVVIRDMGWNDGAETELQKAIAIDPEYADAHYNLALMYLERKPPLVELARRHYNAATDYGAAPDESMEAQLKNSGNESTDSE